MKKAVLITLVVSFLHTMVFSQRPLPSNKSEDLKVKNFNKKIIEFKPLKDVIHLESLNSIRVVDARPDIYAVGLASVRHVPFFTISQGIFANDVQQFLNSSIQFAKPDSFSIVMVIKKCWLTSGLDEEMEQQIQNADIDSNSKKISSLLLRIEFYLRRGSDHFILYRYDTTITRNLYVTKDASLLLEQALISSLSKLKELDSKFQSIVETKRKFSWEEIAVHNQKQFDIPVLKDTSLVRGIYFSFDEFKNNNPTQRDFEVEKDKLIDLIFIKQPDGTQTPIRGAWGYCDGKNMYIKSMDNYFLLQQQGNAFYIYGSKEFKHKKLSRDAGIDVDSTGSGPTHYKNQLQKTSKRHLALELKPYTLDWDNGELN